MGAVTILRMCGKTDALIPKMRLLPVNIYELDFPVDLGAARQELGSNKVILGNVSTIKNLLIGTSEEVYRAAAYFHSICGKYHIVGAGREVSPRTPPENLRALVKYALEHKS